MPNDNVFFNLTFFGCCLYLCRQIFDEDNYTPISCKDESEYNDVLREFPFDDSKVSQVRSVVQNR